MFSSVNGIINRNSININRQARLGSAKSKLEIEGRRLGRKSHRVFFQSHVSQPAELDALPSRKSTTSQIEQCRFIRLWGQKESSQRLGSKEVREMDACVGPCPKSMVYKAGMRWRLERRWLSPDGFHETLLLSDTGKGGGEWAIVATSVL